MPIHNTMRAALRALTRHDVDVTTQYERKRKMVNAIHPPLASPFRIWDHTITLEDHTIPVRLFAPPEPRSSSGAAVLPRRRLGHRKY